MPDADRPASGSDPAHGRVRPAGASDPPARRSDSPGPGADIALVELVNRVLDRGVYISGEVRISVAGVDLVQLGLQLYVASAETMDELGAGARWFPQRDEE